VGLQEGEHGFEIETGPLMVYPGKYFLGAWAQSAIGIPSDDYIRSALAIVVEDRKLVGGPEANFEHLHRSNTEVYLPCAWRRLA
jgi:hypothetical protein